jgi:8-oxo-dGTP pyrophosphatase MutT (NUDIX family)
MSDKAKSPTKTQISAGGVAFRCNGNQVEVALISVGESRRWQLPKGIVNKDESTETAAIREVREETGLNTDLIELIDKVEYWYYATEKEQRVRYHKYVYFYLLRFKSGDVAEHDHEVNEARWVSIDGASTMLAFKSEQDVVVKAQSLIEAQRS